MFNSITAAKTDLHVYHVLVKTPKKIQKNCTVTI